MITTLKSAWIWVAVSVLVLFWLPLLALSRITDPDPVRYRTGRLFRLLGVAMTKVNPAWHLDLTGGPVENPRNPYVVVSNHQSLADIPLVSHLPWEMKWVGKAELFRIPIIGWMMRLSGDIAVDRSNARSGARSLLTASRYLSQRCSIMFFPEGTRSPDGRVWKFNDGAFHLAVRSRVPVLPIVVEGSRGCLPKKSWKFGPMTNIRLHILPPVSTEGLTEKDVPRLREEVRGRIMSHLADWRGVPVEEVDALHRAPSAAPDHAGTPAP
jgi:1-acyl-sn-glycerol-3-phosphate acyltransferase